MSYTCFDVSLVDKIAHIVMKRRLALEREPHATLSDQIHFAGWSAAALALAAATTAPWWLLAWAIGARFW